MSRFFLFNADSSNYEYLIKLDTIYLKLFGGFIILMSLSTKFAYSERFYNAPSQIDSWKSWRCLRLLTHQRMDDTLEISYFIDRNRGKTDFVARKCCHVDFGVNVNKFGLFRNGLRCELDCSHVLILLSEWCPIVSRWLKNWSNSRLSIFVLIVGKVLWLLVYQLIFCKLVRVCQAICFERTSN